MNRNGFLTEFETGYRLYSGWRWYWRFRQEYDGRMILPVEHDMIAALVNMGLVCA
jgi:hypothetical protein